MIRYPLFVSTKYNYYSLLDIRKSRKKIKLLCFSYSFNSQINEVVLDVRKHAL